MGGKGRGLSVRSRAGRDGRKGMGKEGGGFSE